MKKLIPLLFLLICGCEYFYCPFKTANAYFEDANIILDLA